MANYVSMRSNQGKIHLHALIVGKATSSLHSLQMATMMKLLHDWKTFLLLPDTEDLQSEYLKLQSDKGTME